jgi:hypothetical protein
MAMQKAAKNGAIPLGYIIFYKKNSQWTSKSGPIVEKLPDPVTLFKSETEQNNRKEAPINRALDGSTYPS